MLTLPSVSDHNLTPDQKAIPREIRRMAFSRMPMTCDTVRGILDAAMDQIMRDLEIDPADGAILDAAASQAFQQLRDQITQPFRTEQMALLCTLHFDTQALEIE
jgi:hypothetical protein